MYSVLVLKVVSALMLMGLVMSVKRIRTNEGTTKKVQQLLQVVKKV